MPGTLLLGGNGMLGRAIARALLTEGHAVTALARGDSGEFPEGVEPLRINRSDPRAYERVARHDWDAVIELALEPALVAGALAALAPRARHWTFISSVSVYAENSTPGATELARIVAADPAGDYAARKAQSEALTRAALGERALIARPGLIAGGEDPSDRFVYWVGRFALAGTGPVLIPDTAGRFAQAIDAEDLAGWVARSGRRGTTGIINAVGHALPLADFLMLARAVAGHSGPVITVSDERLLAEGIGYWAGPRSLPLWLPRAEAGFSLRSNTRFRRSEGTLRPVSDTLRDALAGELRRGLDRAPRRAGLTRAEELALLPGAEPRA